jgi:hypothetical protein
MRCSFFNGDEWRKNEDVGDDEERFLDIFRIYNRKSIKKLGKIFYKFNFLI